MARIIQTATISSSRVFNPDDASWIYNGLDCCVTYEVRNALHRELRNEPKHIQDLYKFALNKQAPFLEMSLRGIRVNERERRELISKAELNCTLLEDCLIRVCEEGVGLPLNPNSPVQIRKFFYDYMNFRPIKARNSKGIWAPSTSREALEKLAAREILARPIVNLILAIRDEKKQISFLKSKLDADGRMRSSFNVVGTKTGRAASTSNEFDTGTNIQNVAETMRAQFISDPGFIMVNVDLEQADSRNLAAMIYANCPREGEFTFKGKTYELNEAFASSYLDACESGDLHTRVCTMAWTNVDWPSEPAAARKVADENFYRENSRRDMAKKLGHGTNFYGQPKNMATQTRIDFQSVVQFEHNYFRAFPCIPWYHHWVRERLSYGGEITTLHNRRRFFFGRPDDDKTLRDAIAFAPQSMTAHEIDEAMLALWRSNQHPVPTRIKYPIQLLNQVHDSVNFQIPLECLEEFLPVLLGRARCTITLPNGRKFFVPLEAKVGWNWGNQVVDPKTGEIYNYHGMVKWKGAEKRNRPVYKRFKKIKVRDM